MHFHKQNLNELTDETCGSIIKHGRCWWYPFWKEIGFNENSSKITELRKGIGIHAEWHFFTNFYHIRLTFNDYDDDNQIQFSLGCGLLALWIGFCNLNWKWLSNDREIGISYFESLLMISPWKKTNEWNRDDWWWSRGITIHMPWQWEHVRYEVMLPDGKFVKPINSWDSDKNDGRATWIEHYQYKLDNGDIQDRIVTMHVEEREWRWRWFTWSPYPRIIKRSIEVQFNGEVGERTGSWKGGCIGCGYSLKENETPLECLRRMEKERRFD